VQLIKPPPAPRLNPPLGERDHVVGPADARITLVEYGDYQCPHCRAAVGIIDELRRRYGGKLRFGFRHFPLAKMHPQARIAAEAAEAAAVRGKFWEMHHLLFENAEKLELSNLVEYARQLGLDADAVKVEIESHAYAARLQEDLASGVRSGVNGTPTLFINDLRHNGGYGLDGLVKEIDQVLAST
jgi:protein-disulfide isomerase